MRKTIIWVPTRSWSDTNGDVQSQKMVRGWKFWILKVEELYYPCSENKGADQLRSYCKADMRLCFCICRLWVFPCGGSCKSWWGGTNNRLLLSDRLRTLVAKATSASLRRIKCEVRKFSRFVGFTICVMKIHSLVKFTITFIAKSKFDIHVTGELSGLIYEPHHEKTGFLPMQKQMRRSAVQ